ncbi:hypothetical protein MAP00_004822 [Monascus purpureus]|nr:hypothetical protein MAP00_004822 [Monascus purpureus]
MHVLTKIAGYISLSQVPASSSLPERLGLIGPTTHVEPSAVMRIDEYLTALVSSLPAIPSFNAAGYETAHLFDRRSLLHRRLAHTRILLLRPMMACFAYRIYKRRKKLSRQPKRA